MSFSLAVGTGSETRSRRKAAPRARTARQEPAPVVEGITHRASTRYPGKTVCGLLVATLKGAHRLVEAALANCLTCGQVIAWGADT